MYATMHYMMHIIYPIGPRSHLNLISSVLDANWVYGSDKETADRLRAFEGGLLKSTPLFREHGLKDLLPLKLDNPDDGCIRATPDTYCFLAGTYSNTFLKNI